MGAADPEVVLAAIKAAGDDFQALYKAIKGAEFLDAMPGDHRQQLRGAFFAPVPVTLSRGRC